MTDLGREEHERGSRGEAAGAERVSKLALLSLVFGIVWVFGVASVLAVLLGHAARRRIRTRGQRGAGIALAGLVLGYLGLLLLVVLLLQGGVEMSDNVPE